MRPDLSNDQFKKAPKMVNDPSSHPDKELEITLAILRLSTAFFLMIWALDKIFGTGRAMQTVSKYYMAIDSSTVILAMGLAQLLIIALFAAGLFKTFSYGAVLAMHTVSVLASYPRYLDPLARPNILFWAAIPVLAGMILLFVLRSRDRWLTLGKAA